MVKSLLTCPPSAARGRCCGSFSPRRRGDDARCFYAESSGAALPPALVSSASLTGRLLSSSSSSPTSSPTMIHTHTQAGARSVIPLRALQRHDRCMVAPRHWNELFSKCARTFQPLWSAAGQQLDVFEDQKLSFNAISAGPLAAGGDLFFKFITVTEMQCIKCFNFLMLSNPARCH